MRISIVILNYNGGNDTLECLGTLAKLDLSPDKELEIIVVDNASTDDSVPKIRKAYSVATVLVNHDNLGFAEGNNVGLRYALKRNADIIWVLNNDTIIHPDCLKNLVEFALKEKKGGIFSPKIYFAPLFETHKESYKARDLGRVIWYAGGKMDWQNVLASHRGVDEVDTGQFNEAAKVDFISGCSMLIRREVLETVGLFDSRYYLYYEDVDLCKRAQKKGYELWFVPEAMMWHKNARTSGGTGSKLQSYYITRNRLLIGMRYAPWKTKLALFRETTALLLVGTDEQKQAVGDYLRRIYGERREIKPFQLPKLTLPRMPNLWKKNKKT